MLSCTQQHLDPERCPLSAAGLPSLAQPLLVAWRAGLLAGALGDTGWSFGGIVRRQDGRSPAEPGARSPALAGIAAGRFELRGVILAGYIMARKADLWGT